MKRVRLDALLLVIAIVAGYAAFSVPAPRSAAVIPSGELRDAEADRPQSGSPEPAPRPSATARARPTARPTMRPAGESSSGAKAPATGNGHLTRKTPHPASGRTLSAPASWYCLPGHSACTVGYPASCLCAAAGPALRVGNWRGRWVTVTTSRASVRVRLIDACGCPGGRALDLYGQVFAQLAPHGLSDGIVSVRVSW